MLKLIDSINKRGWEGRERRRKREVGGGREREREKEREGHRKGGESGRKRS